MAGLHQITERNVIFTRPLPDFEDYFLYSTYDDRPKLEIFSLNQLFWSEIESLKLAYINSIKKNSC